MSSSDDHTVAIDNGIQIPGVRGPGFDVLGFATGHGIKGLAIKCDDAAALVVGFMTAIGKQAVKNIAIDAALLNSDFCVVGQRIRDAVKAPSFRRTISLRAHKNLRLVVDEVIIRAK